MPMRDATGRALCLAGLAMAALAQTPPSLEGRARTILVRNCEACHGQARMSDLDIRGRDALLKGGKRGAAIVPGQSAVSLLYRAIAQSGELKMPPGKAPLPARDGETIRAWIDAGAKWPEGPAGGSETA